MRKINQQFAQAFKEQRPLSKSNTFTDGQSVWLHGNKIIERRDNEVWISLAGWPTTTTKSRINGVVGHLGTVYTQDKQLYLLSKGSRQNRPISNDEWVNLGADTQQT